MARPSRIDFSCARIDEVVDAPLRAPQHRRPLPRPALHQETPTTSSFGLLSSSSCSDQFVVVTQLATDASILSEVVRRSCGRRWLHRGSGLARCTANGPGPGPFHPRSSSMLWSSATKNLALILATDCGQQALVTPVAAGLAQGGQGGRVAARAGGVVPAEAEHVGPTVGVAVARARGGRRASSRRRSWPGRADYRPGGGRRRGGWLGRGRPCTARCHRGRGRCLCSASRSPAGRECRLIRPPWSRTC